MTATQTQTYTDAAGVPIGRGDMVYAVSHNGEMTPGFIDAIYRDVIATHVIIDGVPFHACRVHTDRVNAFQIALVEAKSVLEYHRDGLARFTALVKEYEAEGAGR